MCCFFNVFIIIILIYYFNLSFLFYFKFIRFQLFILFIFLMNETLQSVCCLSYLQKKKDTQSWRHSQFSRVLKRSCKPLLGRQVCK